MTESEFLVPGIDDPASQEPFRLVKFFSFTGLVVFLVFTIILVWLISNHTKKMLLERSEAYALVLANNLNHQVFLQFVIPALRRYGKIALSNPEQYRVLDTIVRNTTHGMHIQSVTIFDREEGIISYSTVAERIGKKGMGKEEYKLALQGESNSFFSMKGSLVNLAPGTPDIFCQLRTYIPFRQENEPGKSTGPVMGVFEIVQDLSDDFKAMMRLQWVLIGTAVFIMTSLFMVLRQIVARGDKIIEYRIRERRKLEEKLNHAQRLAGLGKMVASVSHEIKNPLGIVRSTAEILEKRLKSLAPGNDHLANIIVEETGRLDGIVREFLDFARPQKPRLTLLSVNQVLQQAITFMEQEFNKFDITCTTEFHPDLPEVEADHDQLYRAFLNILINGVQAMPGGGEMVVSTMPLKRGPTKLVVFIRDTGGGMSEEVQKQIFNPFFTDKNRGTGLGLAIVKNIIDNHHGAIGVESTEREGTLFRVEL